MERKKNILVCPLDWGLGHAARCVPVINELIKLGYQVIIGADKNPLAFLKQEFPQLKTVVIPGYEVTYNEKGSSIKLFYESVKFFNFIKEEHLFIDNIIEEHHIDIIISDNRYGLWSEKIPSIIITHQLFVKTPVGKSIAHKKIAQLIGNFDDCWVPDVEGTPNLSGDLAHLNSFKHSHRFIGPLSRFVKPQIVQKEFDLLAIISGPEPQRSVFEKLVLEQMKSLKLNCALVAGKPTLKEKKYAQNVTVYSHLPTPQLQHLINKSNVVICRSGYSSIMDLVALNKKAILVPTPGQTEQEYLAEYHLEQNNFYAQKQTEFDLEKGLLELEKITGKTCFDTTIKLDFLLKKL